MCYDEGRIQSYIDGEIAGIEMEEIQEHLEICEDCKVRYSNLLENDMMVRTSMEGFIASDRERFNAEMAWRKLKLERMNSEEIQEGKWKINMLYKKLATAAAAVGLAGFLAFSPASSMASDFLTIFRVEKVQVISITPEDMLQMDKIMKEGTGGVDIRNFGKVKVSGRQEMVPVTLEQARSAVDFDLKIPALDGYGKPDLQKTAGSSVSLAIDVNGVNAALKAFGGKERLPEELNGKEFTLVVPTGITAEYSGPAGKIMLAQARGPSVRTTSGVDVKAIRQALLGMPALPENFRRQLAAVEDWQHTALIPLPAGQHTEVPVNGTGGIFIKEGNGQSPVNVLVWQKNGVIYALAGQNMQQDKALEIAGKIK
ncbi:MAG: hypothetical protein VR68_09600 [Peptococcaceae bacterium BRH_c4a]|nr:MAG: hypothetical protein VR68_09600 [Peptococcaceae bacterium BRH_c4a]